MKGNRDEHPPVNIRSSCPQRSRAARGLRGTWSSCRRTCGHCCIWSQRSGRRCGGIAAHCPAPKAENSPATAQRRTRPDINRVTSSWKSVQSNKQEDTRAAPARGESSRCRASIKSSSLMRAPRPKLISTEPGFICWMFSLWMMPLVSSVRARLSTTKSDNCSTVSRSSRPKSYSKDYRVR